MMKLATDYPELATLERDYDEVLPEYVAAHPEMGEVVSKGINAMLAVSRTGPSRPRLRGSSSNGTHQAEVIDSVPLEVREEVVDVVGAVIEMLPETLAARLKEGEAAALAQTYNEQHGENPPNPVQVQTFFEGAAAMQALILQRGAAEKRMQRARRSSRVSLEGDQVLAAAPGEGEA
jgi:hypothetical protein